MKSRSDLTQREIDQILNKCNVCNVAMVDNEGDPYVLPFNFGYNEGSIYIHSGPEGKKIDIWNKNPKVCMSFSTDYELKHQSPNVACSYSMRYRSVLVYGSVDEIKNLDEKKKVLNIIMQKYTGRNDFEYNEPALKNVKVFVVVPYKIEARAYGY
ncbi:MAG TPA: pyridoxamine 5'-phosphate oxidase family protein [Tenuifilaceae bacterium]|nr:pyridoxamine 5'-phosphate oxidase family protein [Tenuifilaceae bacterium]